MREPSFWWHPPGLTSGLLSPLAALYGAIAGWRMAQPGRAAGIPVLCVGNLTLGGAGKTPAAIAIAQILAAAGRRPIVLSRGYGGTLAGPVGVDTARHRSADVGDEPLLLARYAPTIVARDRAAGADAARAAGGGSIVMDDGFQSPGLQKDRSILVVDGRRGIGNGMVFPAGPLRAPLKSQLDRTNALLVIGGGAAGKAVAAMAQGIQVFHGRLEPDAEALAVLKGRRVLAFAGIGDPEKFFATLRDAGIAVAATRSFPDHHRYARAEAAALCEHADRENLILVTTEKDAVRLRGDDEMAQLAARAIAFPVTLVLEDEAGFKTLLLGKVAQARSQGTTERTSA
jgi:tetraacyldisaccharide 4'-kinase